MKITLELHEICRKIALAYFSDGGADDIKHYSSELKGLVPGYRQWGLDGDGSVGHYITVYAASGNFNVQLGHDLHTPTVQHAPREYEAIRSWGLMMGSFVYYIKNEQEKAAAMFAPLDAIYERGGLWHTMTGLAADHSFRKFHKQQLAEK